MKPTNPKANLHHTESGYHSQQEFLEANITGKGLGDPDFYHPPWEIPVTAAPPTTPTDNTLEDLPF